MTHDFAKKPNKAKSKKSRNAANKPKSNVPGWVWLFTGIATGLFISFLGYLADIVPSSPQVNPDKSPVVKHRPKKETSTATSFEFYTLLPEREVIVPIDDSSDNSQTPAQKVIYILQAGSFKNATDADRLRAKLILLGLEAKVESVSGKGNGTWHRVQVGPFISRSKLSKARSTLISNNIETLLLKRKVDS